MRPNTIGAIAVVVLMAMCITIVSMTIVAANARPRDRHECENRAYQEQARQTRLNDTSWINAQVYIVNRDAIEQLLQDNLQACSVLYSR